MKMDRPRRLNDLFVLEQPQIDAAELIFKATAIIMNKKRQPSFYGGPEQLPLLPRVAQY